MKSAGTQKMTPRSIMNQRKAVESRGSAKVKTPRVCDENKKPSSGLATVTPGTPTSHFMWKGHTSRGRDGVTPLGVSRVTNRRPTTPSTPTSTTPVNSHHTPTRSEKTVLFEFEENLLITPVAGSENNISICRTGTVQVEPTSTRTPASFTRSRSASSLVRSRKGAVAGGGSRTKLRRSLSEARLATDEDQEDMDMNAPDGEISRINVGVRVRPLQPREYGGNTLTVHGNEVNIASELGSLHTFVLDNVFGPETSQETVYNAMVKPLVDSAFQGYNACLFAYGQTGSGKTYSMMGPETQVDCIEEKTGIIPRFCHEIIERLSVANTSKGDNGETIHRSTTVEVSYLEVYNEKIRDLLIPPPSPNLKVREHPVYGPYVADLSKHTVNSFSDIKHLITEGNKQRAIGATEMNETSSRSHALFMVVLTQSIIEDDEGEGWTNENTRRSQINLVDLAGSERMPHSCVSSDRLREGVSINRSLLTLGKVISALVERRSFIPYRESVLTWLLKDSLGGNSRTGMLATVSCCCAHQDETVATLRYATQARSILNTVRINESPQNKIIRELRAEIERLKGCAESCDVSEASKVSSSPVNRSDLETDFLRTEVKNLQDVVESLRREVLEAENCRNEAETREKLLKESYEDIKKKFEDYLKEQDKYLEACNEKEMAAEAFERRAKEVLDEKVDLEQKLVSSESELNKLKLTVEELTRQKESWSTRLEDMERSVSEWKSDVESTKRSERDLRARAENAEQQLRICRENEHKAAQCFEEKLAVQMEDMKARSEILARDLEKQKGETERWKCDYERCKALLNTAEQNQSLVCQLQCCLADKDKELLTVTEKMDSLENELALTKCQLESATETVDPLLDRQASPLHSKISVSVQTSVELVLPSDGDWCEDADGLLSSHKKEYLRLKKKILEKKKKLEVFNAKLMKSESENSMVENPDKHLLALAATNDRVKELEDRLEKRELEMRDMTSELELLRELEVKYKQELDRSLRDNGDAWKTKYDTLEQKFTLVKQQSDTLEKLSVDIAKRIITVMFDIGMGVNESNEGRFVKEGFKLLDLVWKADHDVGVLLGKHDLNTLPTTHTAHQHRTESIEILERECQKLQLKMEQKNSLIMELEKISNRAKQDAAESKALCKTLEASSDRLKKENKSCNSRIKVLEDQVTGLLQELDEKKKDESSLLELERENESHRLQIERLQERINTLAHQLDQRNTECRDNEIKLSQCRLQIAESSKSLSEKDDRLSQLHDQLMSLEKLLQDQMSLKIEAIKSLASREQECCKREDPRHVENKYKEELESTKEQLCRKKKRLEKMKSNIDRLEELIISTMRQSMDSKNHIVMKKEYGKVFECLMENSYLFHWEYLLRKARTYAHKYHIPYEFERLDDATAVVKHLLYNAKSYWFRIDFKFWFQNIEKNDKWCRQLDSKLSWEVDFGNYYNIPDEKPGSLCPLEASSCQQIQVYCCQPGLMCPSVWKKTVVERHLSGLQDDARCLLVYFKSSDNEDVMELLQVISNLAQQVRDNLSTTKTSSSS